jgi:hypothetical protein
MVINKLFIAFSKIIIFLRTLSFKILKTFILYIKLESIIAISN